MMNHLGPIAVAALWGTSPLIQRSLVRRGAHPAVIVLVSGLAFTLGGALWWSWIPGPSGFCAVAPQMVLGAGLVATLLPNLLYSYLIAQRTAPVTVIATLAFSAPVFTALYAYIWLNERLSLPQMMGAALVIVGTIIVGVN